MNCTLPPRTSDPKESYAFTPRSTMNCSSYRPCFTPTCPLGVEILKNGRPKGTLFQIHRKNSSQKPFMYLRGFCQSGGELRGRYRCELCYFCDSALLGGKFMSRNSHWYLRPPGLHLSESQTCTETTKKPSTCPPGLRQSRGEIARS